MKLSIIIPTHNRPECIRRHSMFFNAFKGIEIIYVENNSTEENLKKYKKIELSENEHIYYLKCKKTGTGKARNFGIKKASGEYIFFVDDDDSVNEKFIEFVLNKKIKNDVSRFSFIHGEHVAKPGLFRYSHKFSKFDQVSVSSYLFKNDFIKKNDICFKEGIINEDNFFASLIYKAEKKQRIYKLSSMIYNDKTISIMRTGKKESFRREMDTLKVWEGINLEKYDASFAFSLFYWNLWKMRNNFIETEDKVSKEIGKYFQKYIDKKEIYKGLPLVYKLTFKKIKRIYN